MESTPFKLGGDYNRPSQDVGHVNHSVVIGKRKRDESDSFEPEQRKEARREGQESVSSSLLRLVENFAWTVIPASPFAYHRYMKLPSFKSYIQISPSEGDILEIARTGYYHYAIYRGDGTVVDIEPNGSYAIIRIKPLCDVVGSSGVRINNFEKEAYSRKLYAFDGNKTVRNADKDVNKLVPYKLGSQNCEYYVTLWRYGTGFTNQPRKPLITGIAAATGSLVMLGACCCDASRGQKLGILGGTLAFITLAGLLLD